MSSTNSRSGRVATLAFVGFLLLSAVGGSVVSAQQASGTGNNTTTTPSSAFAGGGGQGAIQGGNLDAVASTPTGSGSGSDLGNGTGTGTGNGTNRSATGRCAGPPEDRPDNVQGGAIADPCTGLASANGDYSDEDRVQGGRVAEPDSGTNATEGGVYGNRSRNASGLPNININIPSLVDIKLRSLGDSFMQSVPKALETAYKGIWSTPVPKNSGWHQLLGRPTNFPFQSIHAILLQKYIYPLMSKLLGIGLILTAGAILVNPLTSKYRAKDLFINFVTGVTLYAFSWLVMTTMHAVTDMAIRFIIPNPSKLTQSMDNLLSLGAAPVALYLFGSGGLFSTLFGLGLEFWFRHVLLAYLLPYLFGALMLIAWVAPHGRLRKFASMGLWQYVNVLLWPLIPAAIFRAIIAVNWNFRVGNGGVIAVFVLITLFLCMIAIPIAQTWFFLQVPGAVHARVQSNVDAAQEKMESAASRVPNPLPSMTDIKDSATSAMATNGASPGDRAADMINAANISTSTRRSLSSSGTLDSSLSDDASMSSGWSRLRGDTTASKIRSLHQQNREGNMTAEAMKAEYFDRNTDDRMMTDGGTIETDSHRHITNR